MLQIVEDLLRKASQGNERQALLDIAQELRTRLARPTASVLIYGPWDKKPHHPNPRKHAFSLNKPPPFDLGNYLFNRFAATFLAADIDLDGQGTKVANAMGDRWDQHEHSKLVNFNGYMIEFFLEKKGAPVAIGKWLFRRTKEGKSMIVQLLGSVAGGAELSKEFEAAVTMTMARLSGEGWPGTQFTFLTTDRDVPLKWPMPFNNLLANFLGREKIPPEVERLWSMVSPVKSGPYGEVNDQNLRWAAKRALAHCQESGPFAPNVKKSLEKLVNEGWAAMDAGSIRRIPVYGSYVTDPMYHLAVTPPAISRVST